MLDGWFVLDGPDAHFAAKLEAIAPEGAPTLWHSYTYGYRSARHLEPIHNGAFVQAEGVPAPVGTPIHTEIRFHPNDFVVPAGGRLRLSMAGSVLTSLPSTALSNIRVLHDCDHPTTLRFLLARPGAPLLNVREAHEDGKPLTAAAGFEARNDGGGLASAPVCGVGPIRNEVLGPARFAGICRLGRASARCACRPPAGNGRVERERHVRRRRRSRSRSRRAARDHVASRYATRCDSARVRVALLLP